MMKSGEFSVVLVTAPDLEAARRLSRAALERHLVACANLIPQLESHYWWQGKLESSAEVLILFKTRQHHLEELEKLIEQEHPYDTPEFISIALNSGSERYLKWITESTR